MREDVKEDTFAAYVKTHKKCPICGKQMQLKKAKKGSSSWRVWDILNVKQQHLLKLILLKNILIVMVEQDRNVSLKAEKGIYGVYIHCCGQPVHKYKLDEI